MITLAKKIKEEREKKEKGNNATESPKSTRISVRDKLLTKGKLPPVCFACTQLLYKSVFRVLTCCCRLLAPVRIFHFN